MGSPLASPQASCCRLISLRQHLDPRGSLTFIEEERDIPFRIGLVRWGHPASCGLSSDCRIEGAEVIIAISGQLEVMAGQACGRSSSVLSRPAVGLYLPPGIRRSIARERGAVSLVLSSAGPDKPTARPPDHRARSGRLRTDVDSCRTLHLPVFGEERRRGDSQLLGHRSVSDTAVLLTPGHSLRRRARRPRSPHLERVLLSATGSLDVVLDDGRRRRTVRLDRPDTGLYIPSGIWRVLRNFTEGAVCVALASLPFDEADYIRDFGAFRRYTSMMG